MPLLFRLTLPLLLVLGIVGYGLSPVVEHLVGRWFQHDVELRSQLIFNTVGDSLTTLVRANAQPEITEMFRRISEDERVLALGAVLARWQVGRDIKHLAGFDRLSGGQRSGPGR